MSSAAPELSVETWSARAMAQLINEAAHEFELAASRLRELKDDVDALSSGSKEHGKYIDVALMTRKVVETHSNHAPLDRIVRVASEADVDRAVRLAEVTR